MIRPLFKWYTPVFNVIAEAFENESANNVNFYNEKTVELIDNFFDTIVVQHPLREYHALISEIIDDLIENNWDNKKISDWIKVQEADLLVLTK
jgi:hypothetical protein